MPVDLDVDIEEFTERLVAYHRSRVPIGHQTYFIEISFMNDMCYILCHNEALGTHEVLELPKK